MKRILTLSAILAFLFTADGVFAISGDEAVAKFKQRFYSVNTLEGIMNITYSNGMIATGHFKYMAGGRFMIKFTNPSGKVIATNGKKLWVYDPASSICGVQEVDPKGLSGGVASMVNGYMAIASQGGSDTTIKLKNSSKAYSEISIQVDKSFMLKRATFKDANGEGFSVSLSNLRVNENIPVGIFDYSLPSTAQIIKDPLDVR